MKRGILVAGEFLVLLPLAFGQGGNQPPPARESTKKSTFLCLHNCGSSRKKSYDMSNKTYKGEVIRGPVTIVACNLNPLRYSYKWQSEVTYTAPPDLWSKLTGAIPAQSVAPQPPAKAPTAFAPGEEEKREAEAKKRESDLLRRLREREKQKPIPELVKARKAIEAAKNTIKEVNDQVDGLKLDENVERIKDDFIAVNAKVGEAITATNKVTLAGQELVAFLGRIDAISTIDGINNELSGSPPEYKFKAGVNAQWPDLNKVTKLQQDIEARKLDLGPKKAAFDVAYPKLLAGLNVSQRDLQTAHDDLKELAGRLTSKEEEQKAEAKKKTEGNQSDRDLVQETIQELETKLDEVSKATIKLQRGSDTLNWAITQNTAMQTALSNLDGGSDKYKSFQTAQATLVQWMHNMMSLRDVWDSYKKKPNETPNPFETSFSAGCDYTFATTKQNSIKLTQVDNLPDKTAAPPAEVLSVTMQCASPLTVSAGVAFSTIASNEFGIQPIGPPPADSTTPTNVFVLTSSSSFHPLPIGLVSARFAEPNEKVSFHLSFGMAGNFNSQSAGGSSAEFLIGPSIALFRTMFFTAGVHIGKEAQLADDLKVGNTSGPTVPAGITTPPLHTSYTAGFGFAITFTKP